MNKELEIRAAKSLGAKTISVETDRVFEFPKEINLQNGGIIQDVTWLKFTTSYDWAMLGVKELENNEMYMRMERDGLEIFDHEGYSQYQLNHLETFPSPEQITQAWVEVLEGKSDAS